MVIAIVAVVAASATVVVSILLSRRATLGAERLIDSVRGELDVALQELAGDLKRGVERSQRAHARGTGELALILSLDELLARLCERATDETGGDAAAVRVRGPDDAFATGALGVADAESLLEAVVPATGRRRYRTVSVSWALPATADPDGETFGSALVVPVVEDGVETGALVAFAHDAAAFRIDATRVLEELVQEAAPAIASARRATRTAQRAFAQTSRRQETVADGESSTAADPLELFRERLAREIARAHGLRQSLALLIVAVNERAAGGATDSDAEMLADLAGRLGEGLRVAGLTTPIGAGEIGVLLPEATAVDAESLYEALRAAYEATAAPAGPSLSAGITELVHGDEAEIVLERARQALAQARQLGEGVVVVATASGQPVR